MAGNVQHISRDGDVHRFMHVWNRDPAVWNQRCGIVYMDVFRIYCDDVEEIPTQGHSFDKVGEFQVQRCHFLDTFVCVEVFISGRNCKNAFENKIFSIMYNDYIVL